MCLMRLSVCGRELAGAGYGDEASYTAGQHVLLHPPLCSLLQLQPQLLSLNLPAWVLEDTPQEVLEG